MPHLALNISSNLKNKDWPSFFEKAYKLLSNYADMADCKGRINDLSAVYIGESLQNQPLIYLELALLPRPAVVIKAIGNEIFNCLKEHVSSIKAEQEIVTTMEVRILEHYWK